MLNERKERYDKFYHVSIYMSIINSHVATLIDYNGEAKR